MISFTCERYHIYNCRQTLPVFSSEDTIFIPFFFNIGSIGLVCDKIYYQFLYKNNMFVMHVYFA